MAIWKWKMDPQLLADLGKMAATQTERPRHGRRERRRLYLGHAQACSRFRLWRRRKMRRRSLQVMELNRNMTSALMGGLLPDRAARLLMGIRKILGVLTGWSMACRIFGGLTSQAIPNPAPKFWPRPIPSSPWPPLRKKAATAKSGHTVMTRS